MSNKLNALFPEATKISSKSANVRDKEKEIIIPNSDKIAELIGKGQAPKELLFFGGENAEFGQKLNQFSLNEDSKKFVHYLQSDKCKSLLQ